MHDPPLQPLPPTPDYSLGIPASPLETTQRDGAVRTRRKYGRCYVLPPESDARSPLDVEGVDLNLTTHEIVHPVREGRERHGIG